MNKANIIRDAYEARAIAPRLRTPEPHAGAVLIIGKAETTEAAKPFPKVARAVPLSRPLQPWAERAIAAQQF